MSPSLTPSVSSALSVLAVLALSASTVLTPLAFAALDPSAQSSDTTSPPPSADDADSTVPAGLRVRDPGHQPTFKGGPAIYFHAIDHDFGAMTNAETRNHRFTFVNAGDAPLKIDTVVAKCGCTRPTVDLAKVYQPGESGFIDVAFTPPTGGHQAKAVVVKSNAEWPSELFNIRVIGNVESVLSFEPKIHDLGEIRRGTKFETEIKVVADAEATSFDAVTSRGKELSGSFVGDGPHRGEVTIRMSVDPSLPWGSLRNGVLMLTTSGKNIGGATQTKTLPLRITGVVVDEIRADKYIFQMNSVRPGSSFSDSVFLFHEEGKPIEVSNVILAPMGVQSKGIAPATYKPIQVARETRDGKNGVLITVSGDTPSDSRGFMGGSVKFKTRVVGDTNFVDRELSIGGRVMSEEAERSLPSSRTGRPAARPPAAR